MKLQATFGINSNHLWQQKIERSHAVSTPDTLKKTKESLPSTETATHALTRQLSLHTATEGFLQALESGMKTLEEKMEQLVKIGQEQQTPLKLDAFAKLQGGMMDFVDNSLYENRSLFYETKTLSTFQGEVSMPSFAFLEALEVEDEKGMLEALSQVQLAKEHVGQARAFNQTATFNTIAALHGQRNTEEASAEEPRAIASLQARVDALLRDV